MAHTPRASSLNTRNVLAAIDTLHAAVLHAVAVFEQNGVRVSHRMTSQFGADEEVSACVHRMLEEIETLQKRVLFVGYHADQVTLQCPE